MRTAKVISLSLTPDMQKEVQQLAKEERRSVSEILREAFRQYMTNRDLASMRSEGKKIAKRKRLKPSDVERIVREGRR
jgi:predicted transcriptional regulator